MPINSVVWPIEPHTSMKHEILRQYLKAWLPILSRVSSKLVYFDGFAGPGEYSGGEPGSPIIALETIVDHSLNLTERSVEFVFIFIEKKEARANHLREVIERKYPNLPKNIRYFPLHADFKNEMDALLKGLENDKLNLAPTFAFLDPFGYGALPFNIISRIMEYPKCEVLINFSYNSINRFIETKDIREDLFDEFFGTPKWRSIRQRSDPEDRLKGLTDLYTTQLKSIAKYVRSFEMGDSSGKVAYYLFFASNNIQGLKYMKIAMSKVDPRNSYKFSDTTAGQKYLIEFDPNRGKQSQADIIWQRFKNTTVTPETIEEYIIAETPFPKLWKKDSLRILEERKIIEVNGRSRKGTYPPGCKIQFHN